MVKYLLGLLKNLFNPGVSLLTKIDNKSKVSRKSRVWGGCQVTNSSVDDYSYVGRETRLIHCSIGKFCSIAGDCCIGMGTHTLSHISTSSIFTAKKNGTKKSWVKKTVVEEIKPVKVGNDVWIGQRAMVMGGVSIGDGAVVGAGAIVTKNVPSYAIVGGVPAKVLKYRFDEDSIEKLLASKWWEKEDDKLKNSLALFQQPISTDIIEKLLTK